MKVLLDENLPLALVRRLREDGHESERVIELGVRGMADRELVWRFMTHDTLLLTQDEEFFSVAIAASCVVIISRVPQSLPLRQRVEVWAKSLAILFQRRPGGSFFEILPDGELVPWIVYRTG